jgi:hypothetical protein
MKASSTLNWLGGREVLFFRILYSNIVFCSSILTLVVTTLSGLAGSGSGIDIVPALLVEPAWCCRKLSRERNG